MAISPRFQGPDLVLRKEQIFSTTIASRFFVGEIPSDTVDMQVSVQGSGFSSNPDLVAFEGDTFVIPNPGAYPEGLALFAGENEILARSVLSNGQVTETAVLTARLIQDANIGNTLDAPTGIEIEKLSRTVRLRITGLPESEELIGYNFYASISPGGGNTGYFRINPAVVAAGETTEVVDVLGELVTDAAVSENADGTRSADPLFLRVVGTQENNEEEVFQADFDQTIEIGDLVSQLRTTTKIESISTAQRFSFVHDRLADFNSLENPAVPNSAFSSLQNTEPLYYVATAVYVINGDEFESALSPEVSGFPLVLTTGLTTLPTVSRQQIVRSTILSIFRNQPNVDVKPGSVVRDTFIEPFSTEAQRIRFIVDYMHKAQSFSTLLQVDDPLNTGITIPVNQSEYKIAMKLAFYLNSDAEVQNVINGSFEKLALNFGVTRKQGTRARGTVTISTSTRPTTSLNFPVGTTLTLGTQEFALTSPVFLSASGAGSFFDPLTGKYSTTAFIQAVNSGLAGNITPSTGSLSTGPVSVTVRNTAPTFGGAELESNFELATRVMRTLASVDSGTLHGYTQSALAVAGVEQTNVVEAGHPLMLRDMNSHGTHVGGKVDVWVRGESVGTVTDTFAFSFAIAERVQFEPVGDISNLKFRAVDPKLSPSNPIIEMLDFSSYGYEFKNESKGYSFDLTNITILSWNIIQLDSSVNDPTAHDLEDVLTGYYRYRTSDRFVLERQPVRTVSSFAGQVSGLISPFAYSLYRTADPLLLGRSSLSSDYIQVDNEGSLGDLNVPSATPVQIESESHVILSGVEYLNFLGANPLSVRVFNADRTIEYLSPYASTSPDYTFIEGNQTTPLGIQTTDLSAIVQGQTLLIDYAHDENYTVAYEPNVLIGVTQSAVESKRHITADVVVKEALPVPVDITATIVVQNSQDTMRSVSQIDNDVRTALARHFGGLKMGQPVRPADISRVIDRVPGVSYPVHPLTKVVKGEGAPVVRESVLTSQTADSYEVVEWATPTVKVWLLKDELISATTHAGGPKTEFRAVHANDVRLDHYEVAPNINGLPLNRSLQSCFIIGDAGLTIPGFSDDDTLLANFVFDDDPDTQRDQLQAKRREITKNRVLVTLPNEPNAPTPRDLVYDVTYIVGEDTGTKPVEPGTAEYLVLGTVDLTFDEDYDFKARVLGRGN